MKINYIPVVAVSMLLLSGCSVIEDISHKVGYTPKKKVTAVEVAKPQTVQETLVKEEVKKTADKVVPEPQKSVTPKEPAKPQPAPKPRVVKEEQKKHSRNNNKVTQKDYDRLDGEWAIMSVFGEKIIADEHPMIYFEGSSHRFYGNNGCNTINGGFTIAPDSKLEMKDVATTMMLCQDAPFEFKINQAIGQVAAYEFATKGADSFLFLKSEKGGTIMSLHRSDNAFINGAWQVMAVNGDRMAVNDDMRLVIDVTEGRVHGNVGCNMVNGNLIIDTEQTSSIQFVSLMTSRMTCPAQSMETALLLALENVTSWMKDGNTHVILTDAAGKELVKLRKLDRAELGL